MSWLNGGLKGDIPQRGCYDEESFDEESSISRFYSLNFDFKAYNGNLKLLIVTTSNISKNFVDVYLSPEKAENSKIELGQIIEKQVLSTDSSTNLEDNTDNKDIQDRVVARFFKISDYVLHCYVTNEIPDEELNNLTSVLLSIDDQAVSNQLSVVVLTSYHFSSYFCLGDQPSFDTPLQRCLVSPSSKHYLNPPCKRLEQPNVIKGVPAAVLTNRTFNEKAGLLLLSYTDSQKPDSITLSGFMGLFNISEFSQFITKVSSKISLERLKQLQASSSTAEHIFM